MCFSLLISTSIAQLHETSSNVKISISDSYQSFNAIDKYYVQLDDGILAVKYRGLCNEEFSLQKFSGPSLNEVYHVNIDFILPEYVAGIFKPIEVNRIKNKFYLFYSITDFKNKIFELYAKEINTEVGSFYENETLLDKVNYRSKSYLGQFIFGVFDDTLKVAKYSENGNESKYDENLIEIQQSSDSINEIGKVSILHSIDTNNQSNSLINGDFVQLKSNNNSIIVGYVNSEKGSSTKGIMISYLNDSNEITETKTHQFSESFIEEYSNKESKNAIFQNQKSGIKNLRLKSVITLEDSSILVTGEVFYVSTNMTSTQNNNSVSTTYHYEDIILTKLNSKGDLIWMKKIPKNSTRDSYVRFQKKNYIYTVFRDNPENEHLEVTHSAQSINANYLVAYKTNLFDGTQEYIVLFNLSNIEGIPLKRFSFKSFIPISENEFAVEMYIKKKKDMMIKVEFIE